MLDSECSRIFHSTSRRAWKTKWQLHFSPNSHRANTSAKLSAQAENKLHREAARYVGKLYLHGALSVVHSTRADLGYQYRDNSEMFRVVNHHASAI